MKNSVCPNYIKVYRNGAKHDKQNVIRGFSFTNSVFTESLLCVRHNGQCLGIKMKEFLPSRNLGSVGERYAFQSNETWV